MVAPNPPGSLLLGGVPERPNGAVLKTAVAQATVGSNPTPSAMCLFDVLLSHNRWVLVIDPR